MPLFKCDKCGCVENTALGSYWMNQADGKPVLCSECDTGAWHGRFPKRTPEEAGLVQFGPYLQKPHNCPHCQKALSNALGALDWHERECPKLRPESEGESR